MFVFPFIFAITFKEADASPEAILKQASQEKFRKQSLSCGNFVKKPSRYKFRFRSSVKKNWLTYNAVLLRLGKLRLNNWLKLFSLPPSKMV